MTCGALQSRCRCGSCEPQSRCRCGRGEPSPGADVAAVSPSPGADVAGVSPVPVQMCQRRAQSRCRCGRGGPSPGADVAGVSPVPVQMWHGGGTERADPRLDLASLCEILIVDFRRKRSELEELISRRAAIRATESLSAARMQRDHGAFVRGRCSTVLFSQYV